MEQDLRYTCRDALHALYGTMDVIDALAREMQEGARMVREAPSAPPRVTELALGLVDQASQMVEEHRAMVRASVDGYTRELEGDLQYVRGVMFLVRRHRGLCRHLTNCAHLVGEALCDAGHAFDPPQLRVLQGGRR